MNAAWDQAAWIPWLTRLGATLLHFLWQGAVIAVLLLAVQRILRPAGARSRYLLALGALLLLAFCPVATFWVIDSGSSVSCEVAAPPWAKSTATEHFISSELNAESTAPLTRKSGPEPAMEPTEPATTPDVAAASQQGDSLPGKPALLSRAAPWVVAAWACGVLLMSLWRAAGWIELRRLRRIGLSPVPASVIDMVERLCSRMGIGQAVRVMASLRAAGPMVAGVLKPIILLPAGLLTRLSPAQLEALLAHELAHIRRWDAAVNIFQSAIETLLFYHPAVWWISRQVREHREACADDVVLEVCEDRVAYARALASLADAAPAPVQVPAAVGGALLRRVRRILGQAVPSDADSGFPTGVAVLATAGAIVLAAWLPSLAQGTGQVIEVGSTQSIQLAIDAAPPGAIVRVAAGKFDENLVLTKPVVIEGSGWSNTIVRARVAITTAKMEDLIAFRKALSEVRDAQQAVALRRTWRDRVGGPTIEIASVRGVTVRGIQFTAPPPKDVEGLLDEAVVRFSSATNVILDNCAVVGPFWNGIHIEDHSSATVSNTLVAGFWGTGIAVQGRRGSTVASQAIITGCDVRNCYHRCITLGNGCDTTVIEKCRVSGSAWHGIRYDNASPTVRQNTIFANARSGIYASGRTSALVTSNLFFANEMGGMSCWYENTDRIEGNTFVANQREALSVLGGSRPTVARNIFDGHPTAITCGAISGESQDKVGAPVLAANLFWRNQTDYSVPGGGAGGSPKSTALPDSSGSLSANPRFTDVDERDFSLRADSQARAAGTGVAAPLALASPWPLTDGEKIIVPEEETRDSRAWRKPGKAPERPVEQQALRRAHTDAASLIQEAHRIDDKGARDAALAEVLRRIQSGEDGVALAGLSAFTQLRGVEFDKAAYRDPVRRHLTSSNAALRSVAVGALAGAAPEPSDLDRMIALCKDPAASVRQALPASIVSMSQMDLTGKAGDAMLALLGDEIRDVRDSTLHVLWGAKVSPALERRIIELTRDPDCGYTALYFALSTLPEKSDQAVDRLIEYLADPDIVNVAGRALWGLGYGVSEQSKPKVANAVFRLLEARSDPNLRRDCLGILGRYGTSAEIAGLEALAARPAISSDFKTAVLGTIETIRKRTAPQP